MPDPTLFDAVPPSVPVDTSEEAAESMVGSAAAIRARVFQFVVAHDGATCDEVEVALKLKHQTASARLWELEGRGLLVKTMERRLTRSGRSARVYREPTP
jgi:predicted ArsR family transcriptional regulator